jgi:hypothetical protein
LSYANIGKSGKVLAARGKYQKRVWEFSNSIKNGYCIFVRAKKTAQYADVIETFPEYLRGLIAKGYGCDRKRGERCQGGCQGIRIPLNGEILKIDSEINFSQKNSIINKT